MSDHYNVPVHHLTPQGELESYDAQGIHSSVLFADAAVDFLNQQVGFDGSDDPFFMYVSFTSAHDPRDPPVSFRKAYYEAPPPVPDNFMPQHPFDNGHMVLRDEVLAPWPRSQHAVRDQLSEYYGLITHMDEQIGRIFDALRRTGEWDETIIVYTADHGLAMGSHGLLGKQNLYEHSMGTPLVFYGPGIPQGEKREALVYLLDILPTVCELNGVPFPDQVEGKNLAPLLRGEANRVRDSLYTAYRDVQRAIRDERWKLIRYPQINHTQLFDLESDPLELNNLADDPEHAKRVDTMMNRLKEWQQQLDDDQPLHLLNQFDLTGQERSPDRHQPGRIREKYFDQKQNENDNDNDSNAP
jgi:arylsulfatase A-like enzyme